jgi:regulator of protease activity HflC (stomatin/prohibitin superfamily)
MPVLLIIAIIMLVIAAIAALVARSDDEEYAGIGKVVRNGAGVLVLALLLFSSMTIVGTKQVGIVTSFGKPTGTLSNGFHLVAPWTQIHEMDGAVQTDDHLGGNAANDEGDGPCITVRIVNQATACVDVSIRWRIKQEAADDLFRDYRDFSNLRRSLVTRDLAATMNDVFATYNPFLALTAKDTGAAPAETLATQGEAVRKALAAQVSGQVEVLSVFLPIIKHDDKTQASLDAYQQELNKNRTLLQEKENAQLQKEINDKLAQSVGAQGGAVAYCLSIMKVMVDKGMVPPVGMCSFGAAPPVIVNGAK